MFRKALLLILCAFTTQNHRRCRINSQEDFREPLPVILRNGKPLEPTTADGDIELAQGDVLVISCAGSGSIEHPNSLRNLETANISCLDGDTFENNDWLNGPSAFSHFQCEDPPNYDVEKANRTCYGGNAVYEVGYRVNNEFYPLYESCFNEGTYSNIYSKYTQKHYNAMFTRRINRPFFMKSNVFESIPVENLYTPKGLRAAVAQLVGGSVKRYWSDNQTLSRGHLAAKTDFVFAFGQRASFHYVNCAPQWTGFNGGNWNDLEVALRLRVHDAGYNTIIYTGTYGVSQLRDEYGDRVDIYLYTDDNNNPVIPVPKYFYKVIYDPGLKQGTAFVGINNPYLSMEGARDLFFCEDVCRGNNAFSWLDWEPDNPERGYAFCCTIPAFNKHVPHIPYMEVTGLLA